MFSEYSLLIMTCQVIRSGIFFEGDFYEQIRAALNATSRFGDRGPVSKHHVSDTGG